MGLLSRKNKTTITVRKNNKKIPQDNISHEGALRLSDLERLKLLRFDAEIRAIDANNTNLAVSLRAYIKQVDPNGIIVQTQNSIDANTKKRTELFHEYEKLREEIGTKLGIDMTKVSFDDETGVIHEHPVNGDPPPIKD